jgi:hypothetical protein
MAWLKAEDTFVATLDNGTEFFVAKGQPFHDSHELVKRDAAAQKANPGRTPLFRALEEAELEAEAPPAVKPPAVKPRTPAPRAAAKGGRA